MTLVPLKWNRRSPIVERESSFFSTLVILLLIASSNLGLVNVRLAIKAQDGGNLIGIRDIFLALALGLGILMLLKKSHTAVRNPLSKITLLVALMTPIAAMVGILNAGQPLLVARDFVTMMGWLLAYLVGTHIRTKNALKALCHALLWIGFLVAIGVIVEAATQGYWRLVTPSDVVSSTGRSTPSGWPFMMISASLIVARLMLDLKLSRWDFLLHFSVLCFILVASLLTQSRTLLVGLAVGFIAFLVVALLVRGRTVKLTTLVALLSIIPVVAATTFALGERLIRTDFTDRFIARYAILSSIDSLVEYSEEDTRRTEIELGLHRYVRSPLLGVGLGSPYREEISTYFGQEDAAVLVHNVFAFFLFRYGPLGLILFAMLIVRIASSLREALNDDSDLGISGAGIAMGLVNLAACSIFGNVFASTYGMSAALVSIGLLVAYEEQRVEVSFNQRLSVPTSQYPSSVSLRRAK